MRDTWRVSFAGAAPEWTSLDGDMPTGPALESPVAAFDSANEQLVVFGGRTYVRENVSAPLTPTGPPSNSVFVRPVGGTTPGNWSELVINGQVPTPREGAMGVFDAARQSLVVFGGVDSDGQPLNDLWSLSLPKAGKGLPQWRKLQPTGTIPSARAYASMALDAAHDRAILFAGTVGEQFTPTADLFSLDLDVDPPVWHKLCPVGFGPSPRTSVAVASTPDGLLFFGGYANDSEGDFGIYRLPFALPECSTK